jgi:hypothetical protein
MSLTYIDLSRFKEAKCQEIYAWCNSVWKDNYRFTHQPSTGKYGLRLTDVQLTLYLLRW